MPTFIEEVPELDISVRRPVIADVLRDLFQQTNIDINKLPIYQMGRTVSIPQLNSTLDPTVNKERLSTETRIEVGMDEEITNPTIAPILYPDSISVFHDKALQVSLVPTIVPTKTTISVRFVCSSRVAAQNWQQAIRRQVAQRQFNPIHTVKFYYPIPMNHMYALSKIHEMREAQSGYGESFGQWLKDKFTNRFSVISNSVGKGSQFVIREQQTNIIGYYDFGEEVEKVEKEDSAGSYAVSFTYSFFYERPDNVVLKFPTVIHNQIVPEEIRDDRQIEEVHPEIYYSSNSGAAFNSFAFTGQTNLPYRSFPGLAIPYFDEWYPTYKQPYYENMLRITSQISPDDLRWIGNIDGVLPYVLEPHVIAYMKKTPHAMSTRREHLFNVSVHRWDELWATDELIVDKTLKVMSPVDMNLRDMWHLNVDICYDISTLSDRAFRELCAHPKVLQDWLYIFKPKVKLDDVIIKPPGYWCENGNWCPPGGYDENGNKQPGGGWCADGSYNPGTYDENGIFTPGCPYCSDGSYCPPGEFDQNGKPQPPGGYDKDGNPQPGGYNPDDIKDVVANPDNNFLMNKTKKHIQTVGVYGLMVRHINDKRKL